MSSDQETKVYDYHALGLTDDKFREGVANSRTDALTELFDRQNSLAADQQQSPRPELIVQKTIPIFLTHHPIELLEPEFVFPNHNVVLLTADGHRIGANLDSLTTVESVFQFELKTLGRNQMFVNVHVEPLVLLIALLYRRSIRSAPLPLLFETFNAAVQLGVRSIVRIVGQLLTDQSVPNTHVQLFHALKLECPEMANQLWQRIIANFYLIYRHRTYKLLKLNELERLLIHERINIPRGQELPILHNWEKNAEAARNFQPQLRGLKERMIENISSSVVNQNVRQPYSILFSLGGWTPDGPTNRLELFNGYTESWVDPKDEIGELRTSRAYFEAVSMPKHNSFYVIGGFDGNRHYDTSQRFNLNTMRWDQFASMIENRCYVNAARLDSDNILACGGYDSNFRHSSAEIFNVEQNTWRSIASMNLIRSDGQAVELNGQVYVIGGFDGRMIHRSIEFYDPHVDSWTMVGGGLQQRRSGVGALAIHGVIFVAGGFTGRARLKTVEFYDPREGLWHSGHSMATGRSNFGISDLRGDPVVVGGYDGRGTVELGEKFEWRANRWLPLASMQTRRSALSLIRIDGLTNLDQILPNC
ncbi:Kelch-like protein 10 [Aphelenchoides besseyi]|nr:Kelch-like protein 10 [Aphelenchoides besseyi]KAI6195339.1 Kelch-like protein 10 [Aphelenchoides besseyi]